MEETVTVVVEEKPKKKVEKKSAKKKVTKKPPTVVPDVNNPVEPPPNVTRTFKSQRQAKEAAKTEAPQTPKPKIGVIAAIEEQAESIDIVDTASKVAHQSVYRDRVISTITVYRLMQDSGMFLSPVQKARFISFMQEIEDVLREFVSTGFLRERKITVAEIIRTA
jgi:hypothetical protein